MIRPLPPVAILIAAFGLAVMPTLAIYFSRSLVAPCLVIAACIVFHAWRRRAWEMPNRRVIMAFGLLACWATLSMVWALDRGLAVRQALGLVFTMAAAAAVVAAAGAMDRQSRRTLLWAAAAGLAVSWAFTAMELVFDGVFLRYRSFYTSGLGTVMKPGNAVAVALLAPVLAALWALGRPRLAWAMGAAWVMVMPFSYSEAARIGMLTLLGGLVLARLAPRFGPRLMAAVLAAVILVAPPLTRLIPPPQETWDNYPNLKNSAHHRLTIWRFVGERIFEHPVIGWGLNSSKVMPGAEDERVYQRSLPDGRQEIFRETNLPLHPHNVILQWWLELGAVGAALGGMVVASLLLLGARAMPDPWRRALAVAAVTGIMGIFVGAYGAWQSWWLSILSLAGMVLALASRDDGGER